MRVNGFMKGAALAGLVAMLPLVAGAQGLEIVGQPVDAGLNFQPIGGELAADQQWLDHMMLWIIGVVTAFVVLLLLVVMVRFNKRANPVPRTFTHNTPLEIGWTLIPILILVFIGTFSLPALNKQQTFPAGDVVIKVTGNQWYWNYEYPEIRTDAADAESDPIAFDSYMIGGTNWGGNSTLTAETSEGLKAAGYSDEQFLLATDNAMVVPVGAKVLLQITAADVIHSWTIPAFAVKQDAVPGRIAHAWFPAEREGIYFGQCSELCGKDHAYMPITVKVVSQAAFDKWVESVRNGASPAEAEVEMLAAADAAVRFAAND